MKVQHCLIASVFLMLSSINAVTAQSAFQKVIGGISSEGANSIIQTKDGGYTILGSTFSFGVGAEDIYMVHTDISGQVVWSKTFGGNSNDLGYRVLQAENGNYVIAGATYSFGASKYLCYMFSTDSDGNHLWSNTYSGPSHSDFHSAQLTPDGGYVAAGSLNNNGYLVKTDSTGKTLWSRVFGGNGDDILQYVHVTKDSGFIMTGYTNSSGAGKDDVYVIKTNSVGDTIWTKTYGGVSYDYGTAIIESKNGGYFLLGETSSFGNSSEFYLLRLSESGNVLWSKTYGENGGEIPASICETPNGNLLLSGQTKSFGSGYGNVMVFCADTTGAVLWARTYGNTLRNYGNSIIPAKDGGFIVAGERSTAAGTGLGESDFYLIKADSLGMSGCEDSSRTLIQRVASTTTLNTGTVISAGGFEAHPATLSDTGGKSQVICFTSGLYNQRESVDISIYPVPVTTDFYIEANTFYQYESMWLYDINGKLLMNWDNLAGHTEGYSVSNLAEGMYFLQIQCGGNKNVTKKIVVLR